MHQRRYNIIFSGIVIAIFLVISFPANAWFSETMQRHQLLQLPSMILLGVAIGLLLKNISIADISWGIAALICVMSSLVFWMLPRSIDAAVISLSFNRLMHLNMFAAGFVSVLVLRKIIFEIRIVFLGMTSAMVLVTGIALRTFDILLCSSFNIWQQNETGLYLVIAGFVLFVVTITIFLGSLSKHFSSQTVSDVQ